MYNGGMGRNRMDAKFVRMTQDPVERLVCRLAVPTITIMLISALYNMADTYFVGSLGTTATAAVGVSFALMAIIQAIGFFFGQGAGNYVSRELGAQRIDNAARMAATGFVLALLAGGVLSGLGLLSLERLGRMLGSTDTILPHACEYLTYILFAAPFMSASFTLNTLLRFQGSAVYGMLGMASGAVLNVGLDPLFIFVFKMGVSGAALATMISQMVSFCLLLTGCTRDGNIAIRLRNFSPGLSAFRNLCRGGLPSLCRQSVASVAAIFLNHTAGDYGDATIAAMSIVQRVTMFASSALIGFGQGFQPVCGFNCGAGLFRRVKTAFWFCVRSSTIFLCVLAAVGFIFAPDIIALFRPDDREVIATGSLALRLQCVTFITIGWVTLNNMMLQTVGEAAKATFIALARQGLFFLPLLYILAPEFGVFGIQLSQPLADMVTFVVSLPIGLGVLRAMPEDDGVPSSPMADKCVVEIDVD